MRTNVKIDNVAVTGPNASTIGFAKHKVKRGDVFTYNDGTCQRIARSLGRITAPSEGSAPAVSGFVLAMVIGSDCSFAYERWIDPKDITEIVDCPTKFMQWFFQPEIPYPAQTMRNVLASGAASERYLDNIRKYC